jgi:hypothetical protein
MGTTSAGATGSGSGLKASGGSGWQRGGGRYASSGGKMITKRFSQADIDEEISTTLGALFSRTATYIKESICNSYIQDLFGEMFILSQLIRKTDGVEQVGKRYNLDMTESDFMFKLIHRLEEKFDKTNIDNRCLEVARMTLERFLFRVLVDKSNLAVTGNGRAVVRAMSENAKFWDSLSGYFLSEIAYTLFSKEVEGKVPNATFAIKKALEKRTNTVISSFQNSVKNGKPHYPKLLEYISKNWELFKTEMLK